MRFFDELRQRPEAERFSFALSVAVVVGVVLLVVWGIVVLSSSGTAAPQPTVQSQQASALESLGEAAEELKRQTGELRTQFSELQSATATAAQKRAVRISTEGDGDVSVENVIITNEENDE